MTRKVLVRPLFMIAVVQALSACSGEPQQLASGVEADYLIDGYVQEVTGGYQLEIKVQSVQPIAAPHEVAVWVGKAPTSTADLEALYAKRKKIVLGARVPLGVFAEPDVWLFVKIMREGAGGRWSVYEAGDNLDMASLIAGHFQWEALHPQPKIGGIISQYPYVTIHPLGDSGRDVDLQGFSIKPRGSGDYEAKTMWVWRLVTPPSIGLWPGDTNWFLKENIGALPHPERNAYRYDSNRQGQHDDVDPDQTETWLYAVIMERHPDTGDELYFSYWGDALPPDYAFHQYPMPLHGEGWPRVR